LDGLKGWIELAPVPGSCYVARHLVTDVLSDSMTKEDLDLVVLLTSELVANAIVHTRGAIRLAVRQLRGCVRVEVSDDDGSHLPTVRRVPQESESGRGMALVNALAEDWSVTARDWGKTVSFRFPAAR
jgi:anti-sigma regulatory factor (Ser/Thr protein kinase)